MSTLRSLTSLLLPHRRRTMVALAATIAAAIFGLAIPAATRSLLERALADTLTARDLPLVLGIFTALALMAGAGYAAYYIMFEVASRVTADLRIRYVDRLLALPLGLHRRRQSGEILDRLLTALSDIHRFIRLGIVALAGLPVLFLGAVTMLFLLDWQLALMTVALTPLVSVPFRAFFWRLRRSMKESAEDQGALAAYIQSLLLGIDVVKAFNAQSYEHDRFRLRQARTLRLLRRESLLVALVEPLMLFAALGTILVVLTYGMWQLSTGSLRPDTLVTFLMYTAVLLPQSKGISLLYLGWQQMGHALERLKEILEMPEESDPPGTVALPGPVRGAVTLHGVVYRYPQQGKALDGISFSVAARERIGIVGESGAGKTTLFNLLLRMDVPESGAIFIDGIDIRKVTFASLRNAIAVVPQDTMLFEGTILDNVRYGKPTAALDEVIAACRAAQAEEFILRLPRGYDTPVGERGLTLSAGQRQRLAIARALLKDAPILLMDEATSSLDAHTEADLHGAMETAMAGRTTIIVAHRLATVVHLPRIIVLRKGKVLAEGSHRVLLEHCEHYRTLVSTQLIAASAEFSQDNNERSSPAAPPVGLSLESAGR